jgi:hypothetical protein
MTLNDLKFGDTFILKRSGKMYKKIAIKNGHRIFVETINNCHMLVINGKCSLNRQSEVIKV